MTDPQTVIAVAGAPNLAIDVQPDGAGGSFVLDDSLLDDLDLLGWPNATDGDWLNVVCDVTRVNLRRGATRLQGPLTRAEAGQATIELLDTARRFDPLINADAIHAGTPLRLRAWGVIDGVRWDATLFTASIDDVPVLYPRTGAPRVTLTAGDVIADLASWSSVGRDDPGVGAGDDLLARTRRVLTETGSPATVSPDSDAVFTATLASSNLAGGWSDITDAADAELGRVWADSSNRLVLRGRESLLSGPVRGTLSDWHDEAPIAPHCCYDDLGAALGTESMTNRVVAARRVAQASATPEPVVAGTVSSERWARLLVEGWTGRPGDSAERLYPPDDYGKTPSAVVQLEDIGSQARYRKVRALDRRNLELADDAQLAPWASSLLATSSRPELRVDTITPAPWGAGPEAWRAVCSTDLGDRWLVRYHPELGPTVLRAAGVLGIEHTIAPDSWSVVFTTTDAPAPDDENPTGWVALDVSDLDSDDLLAVTRSALPDVPTYSTTLTAYNLRGGNLDATHAAANLDRLRVLGVGDSITYGESAAVSSSQTWPAVLPSKLAARSVNGTAVLNAGISGATTGQILGAPLPSAHVAFAPTVTTILLGTNDSVQGVDLVTYAANLRALVRRYRALGEVLLITPPPHQTMGMRPFADACYKIAVDEGVPVLDLFRRWGAWSSARYAEATHPNPTGYADIAEAIAAVLTTPTTSGTVYDGGTPDAGGVIVDGGTP